MALTSYTTLKTAVADWLNRTDLTTQIPDFISLAESEMKRRLRRTSTRTTITVDSGAITPPTNMAELRSAYLSGTGSPFEDKPLRLCTFEMLIERRARNGGATGRPSDICYTAGQLLFAPEPDQEYTAEILYFAQLTPLSTTNTTNTVLTEAPDAYLFGALLQAEPYLANDERIPLWKSKFDAAIDQLNTVQQNEEYSASIRDVRLPRVFG